VCQHLKWRAGQVDARQFGRNGRRAAQQRHDVAADLHVADVFIRRFQRRQAAVVGGDDAQVAHARLDIRAHDLFF
jgi:hypothetical protein